MKRRTCLPLLSLMPLMGLVGCATTGGGSVLSPADEAPPGPSAMSDAQALEATLQAMALVGTPYRWGGNTPESGFDCSGLIGYVYHRAAGIRPPRTVRAISLWGQEVPASHLRAGDLVIFGANGIASHAGVQVGEGRFVHAPSTGGTVRLNSIREPYWSARLLMHRRPIAA